MSLTLVNHPVVFEDPALNEMQFPLPERPSPVLADIEHRVLSLCTSNRTLRVAELWFDFHKQGGASVFFSNPHTYVVAQFNKIYRTLCSLGPEIARGKIDGDETPSVGHEILRADAIALAKISLSPHEQFRRFRDSDYPPSNPWIRAQLHWLLMEATCPQGLVPSLENLARITRPLLYVYLNFGSFSARGLAHITELCGHRVLARDLREPLQLDLTPNAPTERLPYSGRARGMPTPFLGVIMHEEILRDDFLELDTLPVILAELNHRYKYSDDRKKGRNPEDLYFHDVALHGNFLARYSELRGLTGPKLLSAIERRVQFAEAFEREFPKGCADREAASIIRFGFHHEGWFAHLFRHQFFAQEQDGARRLVNSHTRETWAPNQYAAHLFSNAGPWFEGLPQPRHSLEWFERLRFAPKQVTEEFLKAVGESLAKRCVIEDLGRIKNSQLIPLVLPKYWELVRRVAEESPRSLPLSVGA